MEINQQRLVDEFLELVKIDSASKDERLMADALIAKMGALGFAVTEDDAGEKIGGTSGNVIGILEGQKEAPALLFCAHMDRVHPGLGIKPQLKDGVFTSDGTTILAADDVAGIVAILEAIRIIQEQRIPHGRLEILFTVAEEGQDYEVVIDFAPHQGFLLEKYYEDLAQIGTSIQVGEGEGIYRMHIHTELHRRFDPITYTET